MKIEISQWNTGVQSPHIGLPYIESANTSVPGEVTSDNAWVATTSTKVVIGMAYVKSHGRITIFRENSTGRVTLERQYYPNDDTTLVVDNYLFYDRAGAILTSTSTYTTGATVGQLRVAFPLDQRGYLVVVVDKDVWVLNATANKVVPFAQTGWSILSGYAQCAYVHSGNSGLYISIRADVLSGGPYYMSSNPYITSLLPTSSFNPVSDATSYAYNSTALTLPSSVSPTAFTELGGNLVIGTDSARIITWDRKSDSFNTQQTILPEANVVSVVSANNVVYAFCGTEGNIYGTNGYSYWNVLSLPRYITDNRQGSIVWSRSVAFCGSKLYFGANYFRDARLLTAGTAPALAALFSYDLNTKELKIEVKTTTLALPGLIQWVAINSTFEVMPPFDDYFVVNDFPMFTTYVDKSTSGAVVTADKGLLSVANVNSQLYVVSEYFGKGTPSRVYIYCADVPRVGSKISIEQRNSLNGTWASVGEVTFDGAQDQAMLQFNVAKKRQFQFRIKITPVSYVGTDSNTYYDAPKLQSIVVTDGTE